MGISLPLDEASLLRINQSFFAQEGSYAMEAEDLKNRGEEWERAEGISNIFADAVDEISSFADGKDPDYVLLSELVENTAECPNGDYPDLLN